MSRSDAGSRLAAGAALAVAGVAAWGILIERNRFTLREVTLPALPAGSAPLRVLHLSDLHVTPWQKAKQRWVAELAQLRPDVIVNTGDNWGSRDALSAVRGCLDDFAGIPGAFVFGSNDYEGPIIKNPFGYLAGPSRPNARKQRLDSDALRSYLINDLGWADINNSAAMLTAADRPIEFFGVDDPHHKYDDLDAMVDALSDVRAVSTTPELRVGVTHAPYLRTLNDLGHLGADILFAGHTHGGQVRIPGYGALTTNCDLPAVQARGLSSVSVEGRDIPLHVSAGLGTSIYAPVRFACPPEATLLTLVPAKN